MLQKHLNRLNALASAANLSGKFELQAKYHELHGFLSHFEKGKNKAKAQDFQPVLKGAIRHIMSNPTLSPQGIENTIKALQTAWELRMKIATGKVQAGKEQMRDEFFQWAWRQKSAIANGSQISLEDIMAFNETMTDVLVDAYGKDRNALPKFELPKPKTLPGQHAKPENASGWMGVFNKLFESLSTPDGIVGFIAPLIGQVIDGIFSLFGGKGKTHPIATAVKNAVGESLGVAAAQCKAGPEAHNQGAVFAPYFKLAQEAAKHFPAAEQIIRNVVGTGFKP